jgi:hypothetical protein
MSSVVLTTPDEQSNDRGYPAIDGDRLMTQFVAESTMALTTTVPPVGGRSGGDTDSCWMVGFGSGATVTTAVPFDDPPVPVAVNVNWYEVATPLAFAGTATGAVKSPALHGTSIGKAASEGETEIVHDGCSVTDPVSSTLPPIAGSDGGDAMNELTAGADDEFTVTVAFDVAVPPAPVAVTVTVYTTALVLAFDGKFALGVATPPEQSSLTGRPGTAGVAE